MLEKHEIVFPCRKRCGKERACKTMKQCKSYQHVLLKLRTAVLSEIRELQESYGEQ